MKKKLSPSDFNLNISKISTGSQPYDVNKTRNTCDAITTCDTTTTDPTLNTCQTIAENCSPTDDCPTKECKTEACDQTQSRFEICCALTKQNNCRETDYCLTNAQCNSIDVCMETSINCKTQNICIMTQDCETFDVGCASPITYNFCDKTTGLDCAVRPDKE